MFNPDMQGHLHIYQCAPAEKSGYSNEAMKLVEWEKTYGAVAWDVVILHLCGEVMRQTAAYRGAARHNCCIQRGCETQLLHIEGLLCHNMTEEHAEDGCVVRAD